MKITDATWTAANTPKLHDRKEREDKAMLESGLLPTEKPVLDLLEISEHGRELSEADLEHHAAVYYGTPDINESLQRILKDKPAEVRDAVYALIQSNMFPDGSVSDEEVRTGLIESGLSQAAFIADRFMAEGEQTDFLATMNRIAAIAKTRTVDPETGQASYMLPPQRPVGAPEDYVSMSDLMKRFEPHTYEKFQEAMSNGGNGLGILLEFAKKVPQRQDWLKTYRSEADELARQLKETNVENRFAGSDTSSLDAFLAEMDAKLMQSSFDHKEALLSNLARFARMMRNM